MGDPSPLAGYIVIVVAVLLVIIGVTTAINGTANFSWHSPSIEDADVWYR